jgi:hypothetical protein
MMEVWHFNSCLSSASFSNIELLRTTDNIRQSNTEVLSLSYPSVRRQSRVTFTANVDCLCWEFVSSSFLTVQLTLFNSRASKCWPPASQASNLLTIFFHARRSTFWNIKNFSFKIALHCFKLQWNILHHARSTFYVVQATSAKFGMHVGNADFSSQNEEWLTYTHIQYANCAFFAACAIKMHRY